MVRRPEEKLVRCEVDVWGSLDVFWFDMLAL